MQEGPAYCCLCWIDGIRSPAIKGWDGFPICREHVAESFARTSGCPVVIPSPGHATAPEILQ